ncbi:juvenile hormone esterase-like [Macrobrachium rosenbergii]|uniref:juvenile hormone esterase-like n=1 Tax=Macrobrachium rosenbergii TaxID=79674 RepID=UPI0034D4EB4D
MYSVLLLCLAAPVVTTAGSSHTVLEEAERIYSEGEHVIVEVAQGKIVGQVKTQSGYSYLSYQGIPYAKPPTGKRRFKDPEPSDAWGGYLYATAATPPCPQLVFMGSEDCLYLNIYSPLDGNDGQNPLPVMFFIHGGAFVVGGAGSYRGVHPLLRHGVILVTIDYRLGVLGFLSTEDDAAPGNLGMKDQTLALRWVNENIEAFGGDRKRITIFGESAGAASVHYQLLSPSSAGLFSGAIMQSGSAFAPWSRGRSFRKVAEDIAMSFHCPTESSDEMIACLQKPYFRLIDEMYAQFIDFNFQPFYFAPRVDGDYIPADPVQLVKEGRYHHVPIMMGINRDEGSLVSGEMYWDKAIIKELVKHFDKYGPPSLELRPDEDPINTSTVIYDYYLGGVNFDYKNADNVTKLYGDRLFNMPLDWLTQMMGDDDEVYRWELRHKGENSVLNFFPGLDDSLRSRWICHGDELNYIFHPGFFGTPSTAEDVLVSELYLKMWTNFAKTRNPTPDDSLGFTWEKTNGKDLRKLVIASELPLQMEKDVRAVDRAFWESLPLRINALLKT